MAATNTGVPLPLLLCVWVSPQRGGVASHLPPVTAPHTCPHGHSVQLRLPQPHRLPRGLSGSHRHLGFPGIREPVPESC